jgi:hypothetical protein
MSCFLFSYQTTMKKIIIFSVIIIVLISAYVTKPDNKTCIIGGVKAVWGNITPDPYSKPDFFEQFMNLYSGDVKLKDWFFFKQIIYTTGKERKTVGIGAFRHVFVTVKPVQLKK